MKFDLENFLPYQLNLAAEKASLQFQSVYRSEYGMLRTEWRVIFHLGRYGDMTARQICDRGNLHKTKVSRAVAALEKRRFLKRNRMESDRRHEVLSLTQAGKTAFEKLSQSAQRYQSELSKEFSKKEFAVLTKCLKRLASD